MELVIYRNASLPNTLRKSLTQVYNYPGIQMKNESSDSAVQIRISVDATSLDPTDVNYFRWNNAYYYLESVDGIANGISVIHGRLDVLMTYANAIDSLVVLADRSTTGGSMELADGLRKFSVRKTRTVIPFPNQIREERTYGTYILTTAQEKYGPSS